jgi:4-amino-4-deoxy-L-arabinose transferase-like glycosyltransferase
MGATLRFLPLLLLPSAAYLWWNDDIPQFGDPHDDAIYFVSAKSLASGGGYRIESLPGEPWQTKYPPLYPLLLSLAWRIDPQFPENLRIAAWLSWLAIPALLVLLAFYYPRMGIPDGRAKLLLALLAINPYFIWIGSHLHSELFFLALAIGAMLLVERAADQDATPALALAAGALAGLAYLSRSAGIVMLASAPVYLILRHARRQAWYFAGAMLPFVGGWLVWVHFHQLKTSDPALVYYTSYFAYQVQNVSLSNLHLFLWKNLDELMSGLGSLILPKVTEFFVARIISQVLAVAMVVGVVRMVRRGQAVQYALFGAGSAFLLLIWHFPPNERFVLPLFPLALAGLMVEMEGLGSGLRRAFRHRDTGQRIAAVVMAGIGVVILGGALAFQIYLDAVAMPEGNREERAGNSNDRAAFSWIRANLPAGSTVFAGNDPVLFLSTGLHSISRPIPPVLWYREDHAGTVEQFRNLAAYAREHGISHVYFARCYPRQTIIEADRVAMENSVRSNPELIPVFRQGAATVYRVGVRN